MQWNGQRCGRSESRFRICWVAWHQPHHPTALERIVSEEASRADRFALAQWILKRRELASSRACPRKKHHRLEPVLLDAELLRDSPRWLSPRHRLGAGGFADLRSAHQLAAFFFARIGLDFGRCAVFDQRAPWPSPIRERTRAWAVFTATSTAPHHGHSLLGGRDAPADHARSRP